MCRIHHAAWFCRELEMDGVLSDRVRETDSGETWISGLTAPVTKDPALRPIRWFVLRAPRPRMAACALGLLHLSRFGRPRRVEVAVLVMVIGCCAGIRTKMRIALNDTRGGGPLGFGHGLTPLLPAV